MKLRLFVAAEVPLAVQEVLAAAVAPLRPVLPTARWTPVEGWHVTLKFLGAVDEDRVGDVSSVVAAAAASCAPAAVSLAGLGAFPSAGRARVLWAGLADPGAVLAGLAGRLESGFLSLGFAREDRAWTPHLTLARFREPVGLALGTAVPATGFCVAEAVLFRSLLNPAGARYDPLGRFPFEDRLVDRQPGER